ncbi:WD repeat-containing protein 70 [Durusdinium trenchii]|uniref:WD repeat-containing protein 70 n=1 Tax=Durusdinium trenchii TaxID=1381693 RepID=A0ABP0ML23_9DINO
MDSDEEEMRAMRSSNRYTGSNRKPPPAPKEDAPSSAGPRTGPIAGASGEDSDQEMAVEEMSELKGFNMPLSFGKQKPIRNVGPTAHNATQRKARGEKPAPKGVQFGPRSTGDAAAKAGAQARQARAGKLSANVNTGPEAQPGPEEDDSEEEKARVGPLMPTGTAEPDELPEPGKELEVIPVTHEVEIPCHEKAVTAIGLDPKGSRMITGGLEGTLKFFDFHGMSEAKDAFRSVEPVVGKMVHAVSFSPTGGQVSRTRREEKSVLAGCFWEMELKAEVEQGRCRAWAWLWIK